MKLTRCNVKRVGGWNPCGRWIGHAGKHREKGGGLEWSDDQQASVPLQLKNKAKNKQSACPSCVSLTAEIQHLKATIWEMLTILGWENGNDQSVCLLICREMKQRAEAAEQARDRLLAVIRQAIGELRFAASVADWRRVDLCADELEGLVSASLIDSPPTTKETKDEGLSRVDGFPGGARWDLPRPATR